MKRFRAPKILAIAALCHIIAIVLLFTLVHSEWLAKGYAILLLSWTVTLLVCATWYFHELDRWERIINKIIEKRYDNIR